MDDRFIADHAPGSMRLTASKTAPLVMPRELLAPHDPSPYAIALHLRGDVPLEASDPDPMAIGLLELGHMSEPLGERLLAKRGLLVVDRQPRYERLPADLGFHLVAYPDALLDTPEGMVGVEYKRLSGGRRQYEDEGWGAGPPPRHVVQCETQVISAARSEAPLVAVLLVPIIIERHSVTTEPVWITPDVQDRQEPIIAACRDLWDMLDRGELPAPDASASSYQALCRSLRIQPERRVSLPMADVAQRWREARAWRLAAEKVEEAAKMQIAAAAGDAAWIDLPDGTAIKRTWVAGRTEKAKKREIPPSWRWYTSPKDNGS